MRFKSCNWITHGITFETTHMEMCCMRSHAGGGNLFVKNPYNGELMDWDKFFELKKKFIEEDEFDKGSRILLNFAHTFGHALESVSDYAAPHGSAVAIGMMIANEISVQRGFLSKEYANRIKNVCNKILKNISIESQWGDIDNFIKAIRKDKKQINESNKYFQEEKKKV